MSDDAHCTNSTEDDETELIELAVSSEDVALEVGYGILGRAQDIHENPDNEFEDVAEELRDLGKKVIKHE